MTRTRRTGNLLGLLAALAAAGLAGPAAAQAATSPLSSSSPLALFGLSIGEIVSAIIRKLVDWIVPDFGSGWAISFIRWLVAVPDVTNPAVYPHLNAFRAGLVGVGFALLAIALTLAALETIAGSAEAGPALKRTLVAVLALCFYPKIAGLGVLAVNLLTGSMIANRLVVDGTDKMLGAALVGAIVTTGFAASLLTTAAIACLYFVASLMVLKVGLLSLQAVLLLAGPLVWGLYPLRGTSWLASAWTSAAVSLALIPIAWALIFSAAALLTSDALLWSSRGGLSDQLQQIVKPFSAVACFWVAKAAPSFLLATARSMGMHPASILSGGRLGGSSSVGGAKGGGRRNALSSAAQTNADRFRGLGLTIGARSAPRVDAVRSRAMAVRAAAATSVSSAEGPPPGPTSASLGSAARVARGAASLASGPIRLNRAYRDLAARGAATRQKPALAPPAAQTSPAAPGPDRPASGANSRSSSISSNHPDPARRPDNATTRERPAMPTAADPKASNSDTAKGPRQSAPSGTPERSLTTDTPTRRPDHPAVQRAVPQTLVASLSATAPASVEQAGATPRPDSNAPHNSSSRPAGASPQNDAGASPGARRAQPAGSARTAPISPVAASDQPPEPPTRKPTS